MIDSVVNGIQQQQINTNPASVNVTSDQGASLANLSVQIQDPESALSDSAEELSFVKDNSKEMKLADRKQKSGAERQKELLEKFIKVSQLNDNNGNDIKKRKLEKWAETDSNAQNLIKLLLEDGSHPSSVYAFLEASKNEKGNEKLKDILNEASELIYSEHKGEIQAAVNAVNEAEQFSSLGAANILCQSYADITEKFDTAFAMLNYIEKKFKGSEAHGIDFMLRAVAADLKAQDTSHDNATLELVGSNLARAKSLNAAIYILDTSATRISKIADLKAGVLNGKDMLLNVLALGESRFISSNQVRDVYKGASKLDPEKEVLMSQELLNTVRNMSVEVFDGMQKRNAVVDAVQKFVDQCIEKEDEFLANA